MTLCFVIECCFACFCPHISYSESLANDLWKAVEGGNTDLVQSLLDLGADPNHKIYWKEEWMKEESETWWERQPPLHTASANGFLEIVKVLVQGGAGLDKHSGSVSWTPLHRACDKGHKQMVEYLIVEARCDVGECMCYIPYYS